jgi:CHAD domain-containing protein
VLYQRLARVRAFEELVNKPDVAVEQLHQLRIAFKGLRYTLEFFREVLGRDAEALIEEIKGMQDHLGALQDAVVTCDILRDFLNWGTWGHGGSDKKAAQRKPVIAPGVASYLAARQMELKNLLDQFPGLWIKIANQDFSRCIASLVTPL